MGQPISEEMPDRTERAEVWNRLLNRRLGDIKGQQRKQVYDGWKLNQHNRLQGQIIDEPEREEMMVVADMTF
jgi:hypothetical protein